MSKEALDAGLNFMVNITDDGFLGEGATENIAYLNKVVQTPDKFRLIVS